MRGKSIGAEKNLLRRSAPCFRIVRRAYRVPGRAPLQQNYSDPWQKNGLPADPENEPCLMVFARTALASGPGNG